jgi:hypothetical protein
MSDGADVDMWFRALKLLSCHSRLLARYLLSLPHRGALDGNRTRDLVFTKDALCL